jgi:hypothetical protein
MYSYCLLFSNRARYAGRIMMFSNRARYAGRIIMFSNRARYAGRIIMFSVNTNIYNKKTKGTTLMEMFTATGKLKTFFLATRDVRCVHHG